MLDEPVVVPLKPETTADNRQIVLMDNFHQTRTLPALRSFEVNVNSALDKQRSYIEGLIKSTDLHLRENELAVQNVEKAAQQTVKEALLEMHQVGKQLTDFIASAQGTFGQLKGSDERHDQLIASQDKQIAEINTKHETYRRETDAKLNSQQREIDLLMSSQADLVRTVKGEPGNPSMISQMNDKMDNVNKQLGEVNTRLTKIESRQGWSQLLFTGPEGFWKNPVAILFLIMVIAIVIDILSRVQR